MCENWQMTRKPTTNLKIFLHKQYQNYFCDQEIHYFDLLTIWNNFSKVFQ